MGLRASAAIAMIFLLISAPARADQTQDRANRVRSMIDTFAENVRAVALDGKCKILSPAEQPEFHQHVKGLIADILNLDASKKQTLSDRLNQATADAVKEPCGNAASRVVNAAFLEAQLSDVSIRIAPFIWAILLGERCKAITKEQYDAIYKKQIDYDKRLQRERDQKFFAQYIVRRVGMEASSEKLPCVDAPMMVAWALTNEPIHSNKKP